MTRTEAKDTIRKWSPVVMIALSIMASGAAVVSMFAEVRADQRNTREAIADLRSRLERMEGLYFVPPVRPSRDGGTR